jgi:hypothetical protein
MAREAGRDERCAGIQHGGVYNISWRSMWRRVVEGGRGPNNEVAVIPRHTKFGARANLFSILPSVSARKEIERARLTAVFTSDDIPRPQVFDCTPCRVQVDRSRPAATLLVIKGRHNWV